MKNLKFTLIAVSISFSFIINGCKKDDEGSNNVNGNGNGNNTTANCSDGIKNQDETGVDCGGVCPPCDTTATKSISFKKDGKAAVVTEFVANRNPLNKPTIIGLIAIINSSDKLSIFLQEPAVTGWGDGLSFLTIEPPNQILYEVTDNNGNPTFYSSDENKSSEVSFLKLEYKEGGRVKGSFSGVLDDGNGNTITIKDGNFDTEFVN